MVWPANAWTATTSWLSLPCWTAAVTFARQGSGPLLVEANTYRMQAHTNADDATRYRQNGEVAEWVAKDPIRRMRTYLSQRGLLDDAPEARIVIKAEAVSAQLRDGLSEEVQAESSGALPACSRSRLPAEGAVRNARGRAVLRSIISAVPKMSPTVTTSSEANVNVSAATARAAASAAATEEAGGPHSITIAKALAKPSSGDDT